ncbi:hypothetical protein K431DRAFT_206996, partial [Polychaeton citri CBS 116435]
VDMAGVEKQRQLLEDNLSKLRQSLKHWHTWEAEYEGLKEEVDAIVGDTTTSDLEQICKSYGGDLVNEKEIRDLTGLSQGSPRTSQQINDLISRRQDYVLKNIETLQRQYFAAEGKVEEFAFASIWQNAEPGGLPLTEIHEELDDDDNVISSQLSRPEAAQADLVASLRKAGLGETELKLVTSGTDSRNELSALGSENSHSVPSSPTSAMKHKRSSIDASNTTVMEDGTREAPQRPPVRKKSVSFSADTKDSLEPARPDSSEKKVSFAPKVAVMPAADPPDTRQVAFSPQIEEIPIDLFGTKPTEASAGAEPKTEAQKDLQASFAPGEKVYELDENDTPVASRVILPDNESEEDAKLRREMLDYHLNEVGNVVAQIDLDEAMAAAEEGDEDARSISEFTSSEYMDDEDTPYTSGLSEDEDYSEDEFGRSKGPQISSEYREKMLQLQSKLIGNLGPAPADDDVKGADSELNLQDVRRLVVREKRNSMSSASSEGSEKKSNQKKRVSFAKGLDIAEAEPGLSPAKAQKTGDIESDAPMADVVTERGETEALPPAFTDNSPSNPSRFGIARETQNGDTATQSGSDMPSGPPGQILVETLVEHPSSSSNPMAPSNKDDDPIRERRELAAEYYRKRNELIRQSGGFKINGEEGEDELMEAQDGKVKKVSRFRAARL